MEVDQRRRQEAAQPDVQDQTTLDNLDDLTLDVLARGELLFDLDPRTLVLGALLGKDESAVLVLLLENERLDVIADLHDLRGIRVLADRQLAGGNDALGLVADIEQDLVPLDLHHFAGDQVPVVEVGDGAVDEGVHLLIGERGQIDHVACQNLLLITHVADPIQSCLRGPDRSVRIARCQVALLASVALLSVWVVSGADNTRHAAAIRAVAPRANYIPRTHRAPDTHATGSGHTREAVGPRRRTSRVRPTPDRREGADTSCNDTRPSPCPAPSPQPR
jgi:hypothetical protein